jgi:beta-mannosidase
LSLHAVNDGSAPVAARVSIALYRGETVVAQGGQPITMPPHTSTELRADAMLGRFVDLTWAYRFGPPGHDATVATLSDDASKTVLGRAFHFPRGLRDEATDVGLEATALRIDERTWRASFRSKRTAQAVAIDARGMTADDDFFHMPPGGTHEVTLTAPAPNPVLVAFAKPLNGLATRIHPC